MKKAEFRQKFTINMIHVVFNEADVAVLQEAISLDESMQGEVVQIKDDFAVGPIGDLYSDAGRDNRKEWWRNVLQGGDGEAIIDDVNINDHKTIETMVEVLRSHSAETVWIWAAQNKHDVCGYYWLLHYLKEFQGRVFILYLNNLPFINEKGNIFYPDWLSQIPAKEFLKAKKLAREITLSEFEVDPDEWIRLANENKSVRLLEGGKKLVQADDDFYDAELKKFVAPEWQKASKVIHQYLAKGKHATGDMYLLWRLKTMIAQNMFDVQGKPGFMKDFEIKQKVTG